MVDDILITLILKDYWARAQEIQAERDTLPQRALCFDNKKLYFDGNEDDLLDEEEEFICMVDTRASQ